MKKSESKDNLISALYNTALILSKTPKILNDCTSLGIGTFVNQTHEINYNYFIVKRNNDLKCICVTHKSLPIIEINYERFLKLNEISRIYFIMWSGFSYFDDFFSFMYSVQKDTDIETMNYIGEKGLLDDVENRKQLMDDILPFVNEYGESSRSVKRMRSILSSLPVFHKKQ